MIHLHIEANSPGELHSQLSGLLASVAGGVVPTTTTEIPKTTKPKAAEAPKTEAPKVDAPKVAEPKTTNPAVNQAASAPPAAPPDSAEQVGTYIAKIAKIKGKPAAIELLAKYGAKRGQEVKSEDHAKFIAEAKALVGE